MKIFIRKAIIDEADSAHSSIKIDLQKWDNHLPQESVNCLPPKPCFRPFKPVWQRNWSLNEFKWKCAAIVEGTVERLQERSTLKHLFVRSLYVLAPKNMIESKNCPSKFEKVVEKLYTENYINLKEADNVKLQLKEFISSKAKFHKDTFLGFSLDDNRLDHFYRQYLKGCDKLKDLWKIYGDRLHYFTWAKPDRKGIQYQQRSHYLNNRSLLHPVTIDF